MQRPGVELATSRLDHKSDALTTTPPSHTLLCIVYVLSLMLYMADCALCCGGIVKELSD